MSHHKLQLQPGIRSPSDESSQTTTITTTTTTTTTTVLDCISYTEPQLISSSFAIIS